MSKPKSYSWVIATLAIATVAGIVLTPAYPSAQAASPQANTPKKKPAASQAQAPKAPSSDDENDLKDRIKSLEEKERQTYTLLLEDQRKKIDWWFAYLAVFTAVAGIGGALIPFLMGRKDKEAIQADMLAIQADKDAVHAEKQAIEASKVESEKLHREMQAISAHIKTLETEGAKGVDAIQEQLKILNDYAPTGTQSPLSEREKSVLQAAARAVESSNETTFAEQLLARAVDAVTKKDFARAKSCWTLLTEETPDNARAWFGLGYALQSSLAKDVSESSLPLLKEIGKAYERSLALNPNDSWAANNWGNVLATEAEVVALGDLSSARDLWQQAREKYAQAHAIKPDMHEVAFNWGNTLLREYLHIKDIEPNKAAAMLSMAEEKYRFAETLQPGLGAYNLACVASLKGKPEDCIHWLTASAQAAKLPDRARIRTDPDLDPVRQTPEFKAWWGKTFGSDEPLTADAPPAPFPPV